MVNVSRRADAVVGAKPYLRGIDESATNTDTLAVIDVRTLSRECFVRAIELQSHGLKVVGFSSVADWKESANNGAIDVILYNIGSAGPSDGVFAGELRDLVDQAAPIPVIVIAESEDLDVMIQSVDCGARGCIPASVGIDMLFQATRLTAVGGVFLPTSAVLSLRRFVRSRPLPACGNGIAPLLTSRQAAVAEAMRHGKANKVIAYELNMCESTVKVHIRNIMKKLQATNRTEAAFKLNSIAVGATEREYGHELV